MSYGRQRLLALPLLPCPFPALSSSVTEAAPPGAPTLALFFSALSSSVLVPSGTLFLVVALTLFQGGGMGGNFSESKRASAFELQVPPYLTCNIFCGTLTGETAARSSALNNWVVCN